MKHTLFLFVLLSCTFCEGQSVLTTPTESTRSVPGSSTSPPTGAGSASVRSSQQTGERTGIDGAGIPFRQTQHPFRLRTDLLGRSPRNPILSDSPRMAPDDAFRYTGGDCSTRCPPLCAVERVPVPAEYVMGPGDELLIRAWGKIDLDSRVTVDRNGRYICPG